METPSKKGELKSACDLLRSRLEAEKLPFMPALHKNSDYGKWVSFGVLAKKGDYQFWLPFSEANNLDEMIDRVVMECRQQIGAEA